MRSWVRQYGWLLLAAAAAIALRFIGLEAFAHADERSLMSWVRQISWPELDPGRFRYPSAFLYQAAAIGGLVPGGVENFDAALVASRWWTALLSTVAVAVGWGIGRELAGKIAAAYTAMAVAVLDIVVLRSHYALTDVPALLPAMVCLWLALRALRTDRDRDLWLAAAAGGLAVSTKYSAVSALAAPAVAAIAVGLRRGRGLPRALLAPVGLAIAAVLAFVLGTPYALLAPGRFWNDLSYVARMQAEGRGGFHMEAAESVLPLGLTAYPTVVTAELGLVVLLLAALGALSSLRTTPARSPVPPPQRIDPAGVAAMIVAAAAAWLLVASSNAVERHYILFAYPPLLALAGAGTARLSARLGAERRRSAAVALLLAAISLAPLAWRSASTVRVLARTDSRVLASEWFADAGIAPDRIVVELYSGRATGGATFETFLADRPLTSYCRSGTPVLAINSLNEQRRTNARDGRWYARLRRHGELLRRFAGSDPPHLGRFPGGAVLHHDPTIEVYRIRCEELFDALER